MTIRADIWAVTSILAVVGLGGAVVGLGGCANETSANGPLAKPGYLGADIFVMGGARGDKSADRQDQDANPIIAPSSSSKVLSAIVFERVTGRTAYPDGTAYGH